MRNKRSNNASRNSIRDYFILKCLKNVDARCNDPEDIRYESYGGRGIQSLLKIADMEFLYERDRPDLMVRPSLDRKEDSGNYELDNCQFLEMYDNAAKRTWQVKKQCSECGVIGFTRKLNGILLCAPCFKSARFTSQTYPRFVKHVIAKAEAAGHVYNPVVLGNGLLSRTTGLINGNSVKFHCCRKIFKPSPSNKYGYWRFNVHPSESIGMNVFAARQGSQYRFFIIPSDVIKNYWIYISVRRSRRAQWSQYENAWHLLAPVESKEVA